MTKPLDKKQFKAAIGQEGRGPVSKEDLLDAMKQILLAGKPESQHSENRTPTKAELQQRYRLDRC